MEDPPSAGNGGIQTPPGADCVGTGTIWNALDFLRLRHTEGRPRYYRPARITTPPFGTPAS
jgi:hypothetical protein